MIRLSFGSMPSKVVVKLGTSNNLTYTTPRRPARVSCVWDARLRERPRQLKLTTRTAHLIQPRLSSYHGRFLYT